MPVITAAGHSDPGSDPNGSEDDLIRLNDVPRLSWLPKRRGGSRLAIATLHRWCTQGVNGRRLRVQKVGGTRCTTRRWLREFFEGSPPAPLISASGVEAECGAARRAASAARQLAREGFA
jgi:hypothetical protein